MRRRSCTLFADSVEEYIDLAKNTFNNPSYLETLPAKPPIKRHSLPLEKTSTAMEIECEGPIQTTNQVKFWDNFDYKPENNRDLESTSASEISDIVRSSDIEEELPDLAHTFTKSFQVKRCMVMSPIAANGYALIDSCFKSGDENKETPHKQAMDLLIKTEEKRGLKCHFWMRTLENRKFDSLIQVYYKSASTFIFVYCVSDRNSFELIEEAIEEVLREVPREKFVGILVGNKQYYKQNREISYNEGILLQQKYDLALFVETSEGDHTLKDTILEF